MQDPVDFFVQAEDGIRDLVRSRGLGDVYKRQGLWLAATLAGSRLARTILISATPSGSPNFAIFHR